MEYEIRVVDGKPRQLAAMRGATSRAELPRTILKLLDTVWPVLRAQQAVTGHNVVVYFGGLAHIEAGVEVFGDWGEDSEMAGAYAALERWCVQRTDVSRPGQAGRSTAIGPKTRSSAEPKSTCFW